MKTGILDKLFFLIQSEKMPYIFWRKCENYGHSVPSIALLFRIFQFENYNANPNHLLPLYAPAPPDSFLKNMSVKLPIDSAGVQFDKNLSQTNQIFAMI